MPAGLELEAGVRAEAGDDEAYLLYAAKLRLVDVGDLDLPAAALGIHGVHTEKVRREEHPLFPADAAAYLHDDVLRVVRVLRQKEKLYLALQPVALGTGGGVFLLRKLFEFRLVHQLLRGEHAGLRLFIGAVRLHHGRDLARFAVILCKKRGVGIGLRHLHTLLQLLILIF